MPLRSSALLFLSVQDVLYLHDQIAPRGIRDLAALEAAVLLPQQRDAGEYVFESLQAMADAMQAQILRSRPFESGNGKTAALVAFSLVHLNTP